ncbi:MAG: sigma 54-interacting transcriptional regulator [Candidatus Babeliales bacterium]
MNFLNTLELIVGNQVFVLATIVVAFLLKFLIVIFIFKQQANSKTIWLRRLLLIILGANMLADIAWILDLCHNLSILTIDCRILMFISRIAWGFMYLQYQSLALLLEGLLLSQLCLTTQQKVSCGITLFFMAFPIGNAFIFFNQLKSPQLILLMNRIATTYFMLFFLPVILFNILHKIRSWSFPQILSQQLRLLVYGLIIPHLISDIIQVFPFHLNKTSNYPLMGFSTLFLTIALLYCSRKIMSLRFLNLQDQVYAPPRANFITWFKVTLEQLSHVVSAHELKFIVQDFFEDAFDIPADNTMLYLRPVTDLDQPEGQFFNPNEDVEQFLTETSDSIKKIIKIQQVLIYAEIRFNHFYEKLPFYEELLIFMDKIQADVFLPIYNKDNLIGYIIIDRNSRGEELYTGADLDEILIFSSYLHHTTNVLYNQSAESLLKRVGQLQWEKEELLEQYKKDEEKLKKDFELKHEMLLKDFSIKHREVEQFKECIQSFVFTSQRPIGIITYKNNYFTFCNQEAKNFIPFNINTNIGHPLVQKLHQITQQVAQFRSPQMFTIKNEKKEALTIAAVPNLEQNSVIAVVSYADVPELIQQKMKFLKDPSRWDYLLYLETTKSGQLVNELIPGNGKELTDFKIELFEAALGKNATFLDIADDDLIPTVELLHQISLGKELHVLKLQGTIDPIKMIAKLFGINPIFGTKQEERPLLERLDGGTLFIKDVHLLDRQSQSYLANFIDCGSYEGYKSENKKKSNVRIICSSNQDIEQLVKEDKFSNFLFLKLKYTRLKFPSLASLSTEELHSLVDGFSQQATSTDAFSNLLTLTEKDKQKLMAMQPVSLQELKKRTNQLILQKAEKNNITQEIINPLHETNDPVLLQAARLGKNTLKDKKLMTLLWKKFDKNQNKIATFLGVNRSTIHRRCKLYNLMQ